jgi:hypothetical protein
VLLEFLLLNTSGGCSSLRLWLLLDAVALHVFWFLVRSLWESSALLYGHFPQWTVITLILYYDKVASSYKIFTTVLNTAMERIPEVKWSVSQHISHTSVVDVLFYSYSKQRDFLVKTCWSLKWKLYDFTPRYEIIFSFILIVFIPTTTQQFDTKVYIHVVSLLHVSASSCHFQAVFNKKDHNGYICYRYANVRPHIRDISRLSCVFVCNTFSSLLL